jgi:hypothetical protein
MIVKCKCGKGMQLGQTCCHRCKQSYKVPCKCGGMKWFKARRCMNCLTSNKNAKLSKVRSLKCL